MFRYFWWQQLWNKTRTRRINQRNQRRHRLTHSRHHRFEPLEDRRLLAINIFDVTTTLDSADDGTDALTLREAIIAANASDGDDVINLPADTFTLGIAGAGEDAAATGDLDITDQTGKVTIQGAGAGQTTIDADGIDRVFDILAGANVEIRAVTITGGADPDGASVVEGGGIRNAGTLGVFASEISGSQATRWGGGISNSGKLTVTDSLIADNTGGFGGGGIFNAATGTTDFTNSTISGNAAVQVSGGGIHNDGTLTVTNSTIAENSADEGGGISSSDGSTAHLENTIVAKNNADLGLDLFDARLDVAAITANHSVIGTPVVHSINHGVNGNIVGQDETFTAGLLPLADNGGPTRTHALSSDSVAINAGDDAAANNAGLESDQRGAGFARILGAAVDAGAYEFQVQEIDVLGNGISIVAGDDSPSGDDHTDFGRVDVDGGLLTRTFTIENLGHRDLLLTGGELLVELSGSTAFSVTQPVSATVGRDGSVTFDIAFDPNSLGWHKATISIANNDEDGKEDPYEFAIKGIGNGEIEVTTAVDEDGNEEVDMGLSLREAIGLANSLPGADEIGFDAGLAESTIGLSQEFGQLSITDDVTINGLGADKIAVSGGGHSRVFAIGEGVTVAINDLTITGGFSADDGGGVFNDGDLTVARSTFTGNQSLGTGGAIMSSGSLAVSSSTLAENSASTGGAIHNTGVLTVTNSTVSSNSATAVGGGGIAISEDADAEILNSTIYNNEAPGAGSDGGGILNLGTLDLVNSIVAGNSALYANDLYNSPGTGTFTSTNNLIQVPESLTVLDGVDGNIVGHDPLLGPLADNGGPTQTHALLPGSPAIEAGDNSLLPDGLSFDQRGDGFVRIQGVHVDIGAFEFTPPDIEVLGNGMLIPDGDAEPGAEDLTDFGGAYFREGSVVHTFTIHNDSTGTLHLEDDPVSIAGSQKKHFKVTAQPDSLTLGPDESTTFEVTFNPKDYGSFNATIQVASDDPDENPYEFDVAGDGTFIVVDTLADEDGSEEISTGTSLREAITFANELAGEDAIEFAPNVIGTIGLTLGELTITEEVGIYGPGADVLTVSGGGQSRVFVIGPDVGQFDEEAGAEIEDLTIADGLARQGGGIFNQGVLELNGVVLTGNKAQDELNGGFGGAIFNDESATVWLFDSTVAGNMSDWFGGGVYNHANADWYVVGSTFSGNQAELAGGAGYNDGFVIAFNSTFSRNSTTAADDEGLGGAFYNNGDLDVQSSTLAFNQAGVGGAVANFGGTTWLTNSVASDNSAVTGADLFDGSTDPPSIFGWYSLVSDPAEHDIINGEAGNIVGVPAMLGPLADNGGWTQTHSLLPGSPAIDATSFEDFVPEFDIIPEFDQRGIERVQGEQYDMGAFEVQPPEIDVAGNGLSIDNGDATPTFDDGTQFGRVDVEGDGGSVARTFAISNSGDHPIVLDGEPFVEIFGSDAFSVSLAPDASIAGGGNATFGILFDPSAPGVHTTTVSIDSNDSDEDPFQFTIQGVGSSIVVDVLGEDDGVAGTGEGTSLREAVELANYLDGADTIEFHGDLADGTIALELGELQIWDELTINGLGADRLTVSGTGELNKSRVFTIGDGVTAEIRGLTLADGLARGFGGAIQNFGTLSIVDSAVVGSRAKATNSDPGVGGGVFNDGGTLIISGSTISGNAAQGKNNTYYGAYGGGIANVDGGALTITNSTISGNTANGKDNSASGGGIINYGGTVQITNSTIADNQAKTAGELSNAEGGGIFNALPEESNPGTVTLANTIVAGNFAARGADLFDEVLPGDEEEVLVIEVIMDEEPQTVEEPAPSINAQHSLIGAADGHAVEDGVEGNMVGVDDLGLNPLGDNGGPTQTHALVLGSPAIDAGNNGLLPEGLDVDQRGEGFARIVGDTTDIGAFEFLPPEIDVRGNRMSIPDGDDSPNRRDLTEFGTIFSNTSPSITHTFNIHNTGGFNLELVGDPMVTIASESGAFTVKTQPVGNLVAPGDLLEFNILFAPQAVGLHTATITIANSDSDEALYDFVVQGAYSESILVTNLNDERGDLGAVQFAPDEMPPEVDDGTSLREAIWLADRSEGWDTIEFDPALTGGVIGLAGGALEIFGGLSIVGLGADQLTVSGSGQSSVFRIDEGIAAEISGLTIANGSGRLGGGVFVEDFASLRLTEVALTENSADWFGGGAFVAPGGELMLTRSLVAGNQSGFGGGGIHNEGWLTVTNSTISGNTTGNAFHDGLGGGLLNYGTATINHATIANNQAGHGGGILNMEGDISLANTIVGNNSASEGPSDVLDMNPGSVSGHHNLIEDPTGHALINGLDGNIVGRDPRLGKLADNGGPTATHELLRGSRARDAGEGPGEGEDFFNRIEPLETDQRGEGFPRLLGEATDIGAFEAEPLPGITGIGIALDRVRSGDNVDLTIFADIALMNEPDYDPEATTVQWQSFEPDAPIIGARFEFDDEEDIEVFTAMIPLVGQGFGDHLNLWIDWDGPEGEMPPDVYQVTLPEAPDFPGFVDITHPLDGSEVLAADWNVTWTNPVDAPATFRDIGFIVPDQPDSFFGLDLDETSFPALPTPLGQEARVIVSSFAEWDLSDAKPGEVFQVNPLDGAPDLLFDVKFFETGSNSAADYTPVAITVDKAHVEGNEGSEVTNSGQYFAPNGVDAAVKIFGPEGDLIGDATLENGNWSFEAVPPDDTVGEGGSVTVSAAIYHNDVRVGEASFTVTIHNVAPTVTVPQGKEPIVVNAGEENTFQLGAFFDPALLDGDFNSDAPFNVNINWGDNTSDSFDITDVGVIDEEGHPIGSMDHTFTRGGEFEVTVTVTDNEGGSGSDSFDVEVLSTSLVGVALEHENLGGQTRFSAFVVVDLPDDLLPFADVYARGLNSGPDFVQGTREEGDDEFYEFVVDVPLVGDSLAEVYGNGEIELWIDTNGDGNIDLGDSRLTVQLPAREVYEARMPHLVDFVNPVHDANVLLSADPLLIEWNNPAANGGLEFDREMRVFSLEGAVADFATLDESDNTFETPIPLDAADQLFGLEFFDGLMLDEGLTLTPVEGFTLIDWSQTIALTGAYTEFQFTPRVVTVDAEHVEGNEGDLITITGRYFQPEGVNVEIFFDDEPVTLNPGNGTWMWQGTADEDTNNEGENGVITLSVVAIHDGEFAGEAVFTARIHNVAPTVTAPEDQQANAFQDMSFNLGTFFDPAQPFEDFGNDDGPFEVEVHWGDGQRDSFVIPREEVGAIDEEDGHPIGELNHTYTESGNFTVTVSVTDDEGDTGSDSFDVEVLATSGIGVAALRERVGNGDDQFGFFVVVNLPPEELTEQTRVFAKAPGSEEFVEGQMEEFDSDWDFEVEFPTVPGPFANVYGNGIINLLVDRDGNGVPDPTDAQFKLNLAPRGAYEASFTGTVSFNDPGHGSSHLLGTDLLTIDWTNPLPEDGGSPEDREIDIFVEGESEADFVDIAFAELGAEDTMFQTPIPVAGRPVVIEINAFELLGPQLTVLPVDGFTPFDVGFAPTGAETISTISFTPLAVTADDSLVRVDEGATANNTGQFASPTGADVTLTASRGTVQQTGDTRGTWSWSLDTTDGPAESGPITIRVLQNDVEIDSTTFELNVRNLRPSAESDNAIVTVDEGETATNSGTFTEPVGEDVTLTATVGTVTKGADGTWNWTFDTTDGPDDSHRVRIVATDGDGGSGVAAFRLIVNNVAPDVTVDNPTVSVTEGISATNSGAFDDPGDDNVKITASVGSVTQDVGQSGNWTWQLDTTDGPDETQTVTITATDGGGASSSVTFDLTVNNQAPVYTAPADQAAETNVAADFELGSFTDPGTDGPWQVTVAWGDGSSDTFTTSAPGSLGTRSHTYAAPDDFTVTVTVAEAGGSVSDSATFQANVVAGFALKLDLGRGTAGTVADGFVELGRLNRYDAAVGYGWEANAGSLTRNSSDDNLLRDAHAGRRNTFMVDVPDGRYKVTITMGDSSKRRGPTNVLAEGDLVVDAITTEKDEFAVETFFVDVTDGRLDLYFEKDRGRAAWVVNAIEIESVAD